MPLDENGHFTPAPNRPLNRPLFDITPPPPDAGVEQRREFDNLVELTVNAALWMCDTISSNYRTGRDYKFSASQVSTFHRKYLHPLARHLNARKGDVNRELSRLLKTTGIVTHSTEPGPRHNWAMVPRRMSEDDLYEVVEAAFKGSYKL